MKQLRNWIAATAAILPVIGLVSCSQDDLVDGAANGQEITTTIAVSAPEVFGTRAVSGVFGSTGDYIEYLATSGTPSIGNVKLDEHPLSFTVGIYRKGTNDSFTLIEKQEKTRVANTEAYFNFRLVKGQTYRLVAYADFDAAGQADLSQIPMEYDLNDELDDAFFTSEDFTADEHVAAVLKRPYGKLRLVAHDFTNFAKDPNIKLKNVKVTYSNQELSNATQFDAIAGDFNTGEATKTVNAKPVVYSQEFDANGLPLVEGGAEKQTGVFTMYLPANFGTEDTSGTYTPTNTNLDKIPQSWMYPFDVEVTYTDESGTDKTITRSYTFDIPVKRNWLTTVDVADFWTANTNVKVTVDPVFDGEITASPKEFVVNNFAELRTALLGISQGSYGSYEGKIKLAADIVVERRLQAQPGLHVEWVEGNPVITPVSDTYIIIDFNGHTLTPGITTGSGTEAYVSPVIASISQDSYRPTLILEDTSKEGNGGIVAPASPTLQSGFIALEAMYNAKLIINSGRYINYGPLELILAADDCALNQANGWNPSELVINGGYFENRDGRVAIAGNVDGKVNADKLISYYYPNELAENNISIVKVNGGSFVDFNPANGEMNFGNMLKTYDGSAWSAPFESLWVGSDYRVITAPSGSSTIYTVVSNTDPRYY